MELDLIKQNVQKKLSEIGYEFYSLDILHNKDGLVVSVVVDRVKPINMEDIVYVSNFLNEVFDEMNPFESSYTLDVSSLGAEKPLKVECLDKYVGSFIHVHLTNPIEGENIYEGNLESLNEESILLSYKVKTRTKYVDITKSNISKVRLAIKF